MAKSTSKDLAEAIEILERVPLIDGHNDWPIYIRRKYESRIDARFEESADLDGHVDIKRLRQGKCGGVFWSAYVDCPFPRNDFSDSVFFESIRDTLQQIDTIHRLIELYPQHLELVQRADDVFPTFRRGKVASMIGVEGLHQIGNSSSVLRNYYRLGVRYVTLAHNSHNLYADCARGEPVHGGLSEQGKSMIAEMNRIGMIVDISHVSEAVMSDVLDITRAPVLFTHSSCKALVPHVRNVPDAIIDRVKANNGVIMISFVPYFTHADQDAADLSHVVDHIVHVSERIGWDHIGLGSDFDGMEHVVQGLEDVSKFPGLVAGMLDRGIRAEDVEKVLGLNVIRVWKDVEKVAEKMKGSDVLEDKVAKLSG